jgi:hypothetical protein
MLINLPKQFQQHRTAVLCLYRRHGYPRGLTLYAYSLDLSDDGCLCANAVYPTADMNCSSQLSRPC